MADVYKNAWLTIALTDAKDSSETVLCPRHPDGAREIDVGTKTFYLSLDKYSPHPGGILLNVRVVIKVRRQHFRLCDHYAKRKKNSCCRLESFTILIKSSTGMQHTVHE
jgi:hypothetical protein